MINALGRSDHARLGDIFHKFKGMLGREMHMFSTKEIMLVCSGLAQELSKHSSNQELMAESVNDVFEKIASSIFQVGSKHKLDVEKMATLSWAFSLVPG